MDKRCPVHRNHHEDDDPIEEVYELLHSLQITLNDKDWQIFFAEIALGVAFEKNYDTAKTTH